MTQRDWQRELVNLIHPSIPEPGTESTEQVARETEASEQPAPAHPETEDQRVVRELFGGDR